jgi:hypothetical protein
MDMTDTQRQDGENGGESDSESGGSEEPMAYKFAIAVYKDDRLCMPVPTAWITYYPNGNPKDPENESPLWCWFPFGVENRMRYVDLYPVLTEQLLNGRLKNVDFRQYPLRRQPNEDECAMGKCHNIFILEFIF